MVVAHWRVGAENLHQETSRNDTSVLLAFFVLLIVDNTLPVAIEHCF